ncbi:MAG TPA: molecular chaperone TorD [Pasteurellaceae bacterium]|nr:molecular chaperone TorD [Pasteurellaceae bacterium]
MLDIARQFYPVDIIKEFIDTIKNAGGTFLHLHFSDHENYALESDVLNQRAENAVINADGIYINPNTNKPFLSYAQLKEIVDYAKSQHIELIPELGSPNHMGAIFSLLEKEHGKEYVNTLKSKWTDEEIDITNLDSIDFIKTLISEVVDIFGNSSRHFHIGGDEFGYSVDNNYEFINYANTLTLFLAKKGLKTRIWNDGIIKSTIDQLNPNIQITYWSFDGDTQDSNEADKRRKIRISMPELIEKGFSVLNYNSYYLYINPKDGSATSHDSDFAMRDVLKNWELGIWDGQNHENKVKDSSKIMGSALSIWGENAGSLNSQTIQKYTAGLLEAIIYKTNAESDPSGRTVKRLKALANDNLAALNPNTYIDLEQIENNMIIDLEKNQQTVYLLQEDMLKQKKNLTFWLQGSPNNKIALGPNWNKTDSVKTKQNKNYQAYEYLDTKLWIDQDIQVDIHE